MSIRLFLDKYKRIPFLSSLFEPLTKEEKSLIIEEKSQVPELVIKSLCPFNKNYCFQEINLSISLKENLFPKTKYTINNDENEPGKIIDINSLFGEEKKKENDNSQIQDKIKSTIEKNKFTDYVPIQERKNSSISKDKDENPKKEDKKEEKENKENKEDFLNLGLKSSETDKWYIIGNVKRGPFNDMQLYKELSAYENEKIKPLFIIWEQISDTYMTYDTCLDYLKEKIKNQKENQKISRPNISHQIRNLNPNMVFSKYGAFPGTNPGMNSFPLMRSLTGFYPGLPMIPPLMSMFPGISVPPPIQPMTIPIQNLNRGGVLMGNNQQVANKEENKHPNKFNNENDNRNNNQNQLNNVNKNINYNNLNNNNHYYINNNNQTKFRNSNYNKGSNYKSNYYNNNKNYNNSYNYNENYNKNFNKSNKNKKNEEKKNNKEEIQKQKNTKIELSKDESEKVISLLFQEGVSTQEAINIITNSKNEKDKLNEDKKDSKENKGGAIEVSTLFSPDFNL